MKKTYLIQIIFILIASTSCSSDYEEKNVNVVSRPTIPISSNSVQIGNQIWMTKNLNTSRYRNGDPIPHVQNPNEWINLTTGAWCYYANNTLNGRTYGKLYNGYAVLDPRGIAPIGWHIPSTVEWNMLINYLGDLPGVQLKSTSSLWTAPNTGADNSSGFTALPSGARWYVDGHFFGINEACYFWGSDCQFPNPDDLGYIAAYYDETYLINAQYNKKYGFSIRCLKD